MATGPHTRAHRGRRAERSERDAGAPALGMPVPIKLWAQDEWAYTVDYNGRLYRNMAGFSVMGLAAHRTLITGTSPGTPPPPQAQHLLARGCGETRTTQVLSIRQDILGHDGVAT